MDQEQNLIKLTGKITYILFHNEENFYTVAKFRLNDEKSKVITVTGNLPEIQSDVLYHLEGRYIEHPKYGMQFQIQSFERPLPSEEEGIIRYLSGIQFPGVGKKTAERIVKCLGEGCLQMIREDSEILYTVPNLSTKVIDSIRQGIHEEDGGMEELVRFLNVNGIGMRNLIRLNRTYGKEALSKLKENPYRVIEECDGFGFATADKIGKSLGISDDDERRLFALLVSCAMDCCTSNGHSYVLKEVLEKTFVKRTGGLECSFENLLHETLMRRQLIQEDDRIYPVTQYDSERYIARFLNEFPYQQIDPYDDHLLHEYLSSMEYNFGIKYDEKQIQAIETFFSNSFMILTGGPGTGKTTVVHAMVDLFRMLYPSSTIICAAPTGRAAKRLAELTETNCSTIHSLLQWDLEANTFGKNEEEPILADLLIVDEFSMVDVWLFANLLKASHRIRKICIIGDENQLPSVGPGCVLRDIIASDMFPLIRLEHIYRQANGSGVISLANDINNGFVNSAYSSEVGFFECGLTEIRQGIISIVSNALEKGYSIDDIQVLSPMYNGTAGIDVLNNALQECFNPPQKDKKEIKIGYMVLREGDKILQLKNQPDDDVYNGDIGILEEIIDAKYTDNHMTTIVVDFQGIFVEYNQENWNNITLAYCISVHKSQGSEYPIVIMPFTYQMGFMLQRKLIYTGVTRARKALVILGQLGAMRKGIEVIERVTRMTTLKERLLAYSEDPFGGI